MNGTPTISVLVEGEPRLLPAGTSLAALVASLQHEAHGVTTAVNAQFVPRAQREQRVLQSGDVVLLFQPIVGG
jgi:sulfur carrier protein